MGGNAVRVWIGRSILVVGTIHTLLGIVFLRGAFAQVLSNGVFGAVTLTVQSSMATAFWFFVSGALALILGGLVHYLERIEVAFPAFLPWSLVALTIAGCVLMPVSAWWLLLAPVAGMYLRARGTASVHAGTN